MPIPPFIPNVELTAPVISPETPVANYDERKLVTPLRDNMGLSTRVRHMPLGAPSPVGLRNLASFGHCTPQFVGRMRRIPRGGSIHTLRFIPKRTSPTSWKCG